MNGVQTRFKCKLDVKRCKRFVFPPSSLLPRSNALKTKAIRYFQTDRTLTRIVSPPLLNYARRMTDDPSDAEDAVQEVMLKLWNLRQKLDEYRSIEAVAMTMTHHLCMDMWRAKRPDTLSLDRVQAPTPSATPERLLEEKDEFRLMREIIDSLPTLQRTIIRMKDIEEYETEEIAEITGCNAEAIRSNLSRARKKVREVYLQTIQERKRRNKA